MSEPPPPERPKRRWAWSSIIRVTLGAIGLAVVGWMVHDIGWTTLSEVLSRAIWWVPLAALLELGRVASDALASRWSIRRGPDIPWLALLGSHLVAYAVMGVAPAGRPTSEAVKAGLLSRYIGGPTAVALGTTNQANVLISTALFSGLNAAAAYAMTGMSILTIGLLIHFVSMNVVGVGLRIFARHRKVNAYLATRWPKLAAKLEAFGEASRDSSVLAWRPVGAMAVGRCFQTAHFAVLAYAVSANPTWVSSLALHGVYLLAAALGVMIPAQIGATEGAFALSADALRTSVATATAIALLAHIVQLLLVAVGFALLTLWPKRAGDS